MTQEQKQACLLGYSGLIPFFVLAVIFPLTDGELSLHVGSALLVYSAIILSFMGGVVWGRGLAGMRDEGLVASLVVSVIPALVAWVGATWGGPLGAAICCLGLIGLLIHDIRTRALPDWFKRLRIHLTIGAVLATASLVVFG